MPHCRLSAFSASHSRRRRSTARCCGCSRRRVVAGAHVRHAEDRRELQLGLVALVVVVDMPPPGLFGPGHVFGMKPWLPIASRSNSSRKPRRVPRRPGRPLAIRGGDPARRRVRRIAAGVGGVLAVAGELDLLEAGVPRNSNSSSQPPGSGTSGPRSWGPPGSRAAEEAHRGGHSERRAGRDADPPRHVTLGEGDRAQLAVGDEPPARGFVAVATSGEPYPGPVAHAAAAPRPHRREPPPAERPLQGFGPAQYRRWRLAERSSPPRGVELGRAHTLSDELDPVEVEQVVAGPPGTDRNTRNSLCVPPGSAIGNVWLTQCRRSVDRAVQRRPVDRVRRISTSPVPAAPAAARSGT